MAHTVEIPPNAYWLRGLNPWDSVSCLDLVPDLMPNHGETNKHGGLIEFMEIRFLEFNHNFYTFFYDVFARLFHGG